MAVIRMIRRTSEDVLKEDAPFVIGDYVVSILKNGAHRVVVTYDGNRSFHITGQTFVGGVPSLWKRIKKFFIRES